MMLRKIVTRILLGVLALIVVSAGGAWLFWPKSWTVNAPITNSLFGWGGEPTPEDALRKQLTIPAGATINIYANGLSQARILRWTAGGDLLVSVPRKGEVLLLRRDANHDGRADGTKVLVEGLNRPHGLELHDGWLYIGETDAIARIRFDEATGAVSGAVERIVTGLPGGGNHWTRTLRMGPDGFMYVNVGSDCNVCIETDPRRATIMRFRPDGSGLEVYADGLRNAVGFDWDPQGQLWAVVNGRDLLGDDFPPDQLQRVEKGKFYGWPYRNGDNVPDPDFGNHQDPRLASYAAPWFALPPHGAALSIKFLTGANAPHGYEGKALVALHGSWNRTKKIGYEVVALSWDAGGKVSLAPFVSGFQSNENVIGRPVDTAQGPDGAIYISDDYAGAVYRLSFSGETAAATPAPAVAGGGTELRESFAPASIDRGKRLFETTGCLECHGSDAPPERKVPLKALRQRYNAQDIAALLAAPPSNMPLFELDAHDKQDLAAYLLTTHP
ncbi:MAG: PQQ-dependent sugar dehydrogenase [Parvibaculaceae bacterium]|nr:PQQ-dependent sugar dehydrogenase [Parvibaculaceae bacterium]